MKYFRSFRGKHVINDNVKVLIFANSFKSTSSHNTFQIGKLQEAQGVGTYLTWIRARPLPPRSWDIHYCGFASQVTLVLLQCLSLLKIFHILHRKITCFPNHQTLSNLSVSKLVQKLDQSLLPRNRVIILCLLLHQTY